MNQVYPEYHAFDRFVVYRVHGWLQKDTDPLARPMIRIAEDPKGVREAFSAMVYHKCMVILVFAFC